MIRWLLAQASAPELSPAWAERLTVPFVLVVALIFGHRRVWAWMREVTQRDAIIAERDAEIKRLHAYYAGELARERARADRYEDRMIRHADIVAESLPRIDRRLNERGAGETP